MCRCAAKPVGFLAHEAYSSACGKYATSGMRLPACEPPRDVPAGPDPRGTVYLPAQPPPPFPSTIDVASLATQSHSPRAVAGRWWVMALGVLVNAR